MRFWSSSDRVVPIHTYTGLFNIPEGFFVKPVGFRATDILYFNVLPIHLKTYYTTFLNSRQRKKIISNFNSSFKNTISSWCFFCYYSITVSFITHCSAVYFLFPAKHLLLTSISSFVIQSHSPQLLFAKLFCRLKSNDFFYFPFPNRTVTKCLFFSRIFMPDKLNIPLSLGLVVREYSLF
jgi:hypothetical protein